MVWLTDEKCLTLFSNRDPHYRKSPAHCEQAQEEKKKKKNIYEYYYNQNYYYFIIIIITIIVITVMYK